MIERYIGGGKLYISRYNGVGYDAEVEIGEIQSAKLSIKQNYADATSKDNGTAVKVDKVAISTEATLNFSTQNLSKENLAIAMYGSLTTESFAIGAKLPDGTVATAATTLSVIKGGALSKVEAKVRIVGKNLSGEFNPVLLVHHAVLMPNGDVRDYFADKHGALAFDGEIMEVNGEYFREYYIPKA